jgi:hypothetical protein
MMETGLRQATNVCDQIDTRELLHKLATNAEQCSAEEPLWTLLEDHQESFACRSLAFFSQRSFDFLHFSADVYVILSDDSVIVLQSP